MSILTDRDEIAGNQCFALKTYPSGRFSAAWHLKLMARTLGGYQFYGSSVGASSMQFLPHKARKEGYIAILGLNGKPAKAYRTRTRTESKFYFGGHIGGLKKSRVFLIT